MNLADYQPSSINCSWQRPQHNLTLIKMFKFINANAENYAYSHHIAVLNNSVLKVRLPYQLLHVYFSLHINNRRTREVTDLKTLRCLAGYHLIDNKNNTDYPRRIKYTRIMPWK